jgi:hypothetical protein
MVSYFEGGAGPAGISSAPRSPRWRFGRFGVPLSFLTLPLWWYALQGV